MTKSQETRKLEYMVIGDSYSIEYLNDIRSRCVDDDAYQDKLRNLITYLKHSS